MDTNTQVKVIRASEHEIHDQIADASCFYFSPINIEALVREFQMEGKDIVALPGRIEVTDKDGSLHYHHGITIAFITAGFGMIKTPSGDVAVRTGDMIIVPPKAKHLSIAAPGTTMTEHIVFIGAKGDLQTVYDV